MGEVHPIDGIRNICLAGHASSGKTTLAEAMLFHCKATTRQGRVEDGSTISDHLPEEKDRRSSIVASLMTFTFKNHVLNLFDTPGYNDFIGETISGIVASDAVLLFLAPGEGISAGTRKIHNSASGMGKPMAIVLSRLDSENVNFQETLDIIRSAFGERCIPFTAPVGVGPGLTGTVSVMDSGDSLPALVPEGADKWREKIVEAAVETNDALMEKYLEGGALSQSEIDTAIRKAILDRSLIPVFCVAGEKGAGVPELVDCILRYLPGPDESAAPPLADGSALAISSDGPIVAQVFKTVIDDYVGKMAYFRVYSGKLKAEESVSIFRTGKTERVVNLFSVFGKEQKPVDETVTGGIYAVAKIEGIDVCDTLCGRGKSVEFAKIKYPEPMVSLAVEPKSRQDEQKISGSLAKIAVEDPTFIVNRDQRTAELVITGMSQLHLDLKIKMLKRRYNVEVVTKIPKVPYMETITAKGDDKYRHKKQTGGAGQFAEVWMRIEPLVNEVGRPEGYEYESAVVGGSISGSFIPSIEKGVKQVLQIGPIAGYPVTGVKVIVYDGKEHPVDSKDIAFQIAGREVFKLAMKSAKPKLLEPIMTLEVSVPSRFMGELTGDLNSRRGRIQGMGAEGDIQTIKAIVPLAEVQTYSTELKSMTQDEGIFTLTFSHYEIVPDSAAQAVIQKSQREKEEEKE